MAKKKKSKRKVSTKTKAKRVVMRAEKSAKKVGKKAKREAKKLAREAKPLGKKVKRGAKKVGRKAKKIAKSDAGRAGIGAGAGALLLGPVGAVAGAAAGLATRKNPGRKRKRNVSAFEPSEFGRPEISEEKETSRVRRRPSPGHKLARVGLRPEDKARMALEDTEVANPEPMVKINSVMGSILLDYQKASPAIEHVAASALRGERVELSVLRRARADLYSLYEIQSQAAEQEQIGDLIRALDKLISKASRSMARRNPVRAFSLETQVKRGRQSRAKKAAMGMARHSKVYGEVKSKSLAARLRKINPGHPEMSERHSMLDDLTDDYRKARKRWLSVSTKASSSEGSVIRAQKRMEDAEDKLVLYADMIDLSPKDLKIYLTKHKQKRPKSNPSSSVHLSQGKKRLKMAEESLKKGRQTGGLQVLLRASNAAAVAHSEFMNAGEMSGKNIELAHKIYDEAAGLIESKCLSSPRMQPSLNPGVRLKHLGPRAKKASIRDTVGHNIAKLSESKDPRTGKVYKQQQAIAIALTQARDDAEKRTAQKRLLTRMYGKAPRRNPLHTRPEKPTKKKRKTSKRPRPYQRKRAGGGRRNPLAHIPKGAGIQKIRSVVSKNISTEMDAGKPQKQAVAIAISTARDDADRIGGTTAKLIRAEYPSLNPKNNPGVKLHHIAPRAKKEKIRETIGRNIAKLSESKDPRTGKTYKQQQAIAIALTQAREDVNGRTEQKRLLTRMYGKAPNHNPLAHIPKGAGIRKIRSVVSKNISTEMDAGKPQKQAVAIAISTARDDADRIGGTTAKLIRAEYPSLNPRSIKKLTKIPKGMEIKRLPPGKAEGAELPGEFAGGIHEGKYSGHKTKQIPLAKGIGVRAFRSGNPKKKGNAGRGKKVASFAAFMKLPVGTVVTVHGRTGKVVRHYTGEKGLYAAPTEWYFANEEAGDDPLGAGARYFFAEDLEEFIRSGKEANPKKKPVVRRKASKKTKTKEQKEQLERELKEYDTAKVKWQEKKENPKKKATKKGSKKRSNPMEGRSNPKRAKKASKNPTRRTGYRRLTPKQRKELLDLRRRLKRIHEVNSGWIDEYLRQDKEPIHPMGVPRASLRELLRAQWGGAGDGYFDPEPWRSEESYEHEAEEIAKTMKRLGYPLDNPKRAKKKAKKKVAKKKTKKKASKRKVTPEWQRLVRRCQKLWDHYCERPGKTRLKDVFKHLEKMEGHASKKVREERGRCMRAAKAEAKRLKLKV